MKKWFKKLFRRRVLEKTVTLKTIKDLQVKDDVFVIIDNIPHKGWITAKSRKLLQIYIWDNNEEIIVYYRGKEDQNVISFGNNNYMILNKGNICDYLS